MKKVSIFLLGLLFLVVGAARAEELSTRLKGRILLQVESNGEAWYVNPDTEKRFYLGRPADAFSVMREQGLGISNKDFASFSGVAPKRLAGKILLKVESKGEAYYINPLDLKMHYLGRPADAFSVMRNLGLGITNSNLALIAVDEKSSPVITAPKSEEVIIAPEPEITATTTEEVIIETPAETATGTEEMIVETPAETATTSCVWLVEYFDNKSLLGTPVATGSVNAIDFDWGSAGPEQFSFFDRFSIRYTANCDFLAGNYEFRTVFDDGLKVYLDNENFMQSWADNDREMTFNRERNIEAGSHEVKVEYYEASRNAKVKVSWVKIN
ncbi:MAG: PA14 domain-containing protein [Patescibacteria group bacterium]|jgi:hypothetical protein